jgi:hypothetical protein
MNPITTAVFCRKFLVRGSFKSAHHAFFDPSLPGADFQSDRFRCGGRESNFLQKPTPVNYQLKCTGRCVA